LANKFWKEKNKNLLVNSNPVFTKGNPYNVKVGPTYYMIADDARDACW